jgi:hypothetical protein
LPKNAIDKKEPTKAPIVPKKKSLSPAAPKDPAYVPIDESADPKDLVDQQLNDMQDKIDERDPKLYVDVNIGKNGMERIVVYEGDTAESLAEQFCEKHKLNKDMKEKLKILLDQQIAGVLPKIMEDEDLDDSEQEKSPSQSPQRDNAPGSASQNRDSPKVPVTNVKP